MAKDTSKPISFKTIQKNTKLEDFVIEDDTRNIPEEQKLID